MKAHEVHWRSIYFPLFTAIYLPPPCQRNYSGQGKSVLVPKHKWHKQLKLNL